MALLHVDFFSDVLGMSMNMDVLLPQQTQGQIGMEGRAAQGKYKTMYLLHGMSDDQTIWQRRTSIERYVSSLGIAVVMPTTHLGFYTDTTYGMRYWTFLSQELPKICREFFPQMSAEREDTLAAGLSMGGYGAWKLGLGAGVQTCALTISGDFRLGPGAGGLGQRSACAGGEACVRREGAAQALRLVRDGGLPVPGELKGLGACEEPGL